MPIRKVQFVTGHYYHLYNRGTDRKTIFPDDHAYCKFLADMKKNISKFQIAVIAYCLMPNHFHFLLRQDGNIKAGVPLQNTCNGYAQWLNRLHNRTGTLFEGRYKALPVEQDEYLHHLCRYIHANPVKDGLALQPELWPYSNYLEWIGQRPGTLVDHNFISEHFRTVEAYQAYLQVYLSQNAAIPAKLRDYLAAL